MRIGILTLHSGANYGGTLQCIALYKVLKLTGNEVDIIDFEPQFICSLVRRFFYRIMLINSFTDFKSLFKKHQKLRGRSVSKKLCGIFDEYRAERLTFSPKCNELTISKACENYDVIVVGSDQVWSSTVRTHLTYFGDWQPFKGKLYSYAACATSTKYPLVRKWKLRRLLNRFETISVRDNLSKDFVGNILPNRMVRVDLDPTLIYSFDEFIVQSKKIIDDYILVYVLGKEILGGNKSAIDKIKSFVGDVRVIAITVYDEDIPYADETLKTANPSDWINYIRNAKFVFTDSFHGEVFSLKFHKDFYVYYAEMNRASRILSLSALYHVEDRIVTSINDITGFYKKEISVSNVEEKKRMALSYLNHIVE